MKIDKGESDCQWQILYPTSTYQGTELITAVNRFMKQMPGALFTIFSVICNLQIERISYNVCFCQAFPILSIACWPNWKTSNQAINKHSRLTDPLIRYEENEVL